MHYELWSTRTGETSSKQYSDTGMNCLFYNTNRNGQGSSSASMVTSLGKGCILGCVGLLLLFKTGKHGRCIVYHKPPAFVSGDLLTTLVSSSSLKCLPISPRLGRIAFWSVAAGCQLLSHQEPINTSLVTATPAPRSAVRVSEDAPFRVVSLSTWYKVSWHCTKL